MSEEEDNSVRLPRVFIKDGVTINGAHFYPESVKMVTAARATAPLLADDAVWITSANDSKHMEGSLHYANRAFDIRTFNIVGPVQSIAAQWVTKMELVLGDDYDVVLEKDHIHVEFDT